MSDGDDRSPPPLLARLLFGGAVGFMAGGNFLDIEGSIEYAESKGVPMADVLVPFASGMATVGAVGVVLWRLPTLAAGAVATFLAGITPTMHDFWTMEGQQREQQQFQFLKNVALFATALSFIQRARSLSSSDDSGGGGDADGPGDDEGGFVDLELADEADAATDADDGTESVSAD